MKISLLFSQLWFLLRYEKLTISYHAYLPKISNTVDIHKLHTSMD